MLQYFTRSCVIISFACVIFLVNLDDFFIVVCTGFHSSLVSIAYVAILSYSLQIGGFKLVLINFHKCKVRKYHNVEKVVLDWNETFYDRPTILKYHLN